MRTTRRVFRGSAMLAPMGARLFAGGEKSLFRFGVMTDTHVGKTVESCGRVKLALELFREKGCELVINTGGTARWNIRLCNAKGPGFGSTRYPTPSGQSGKRRYVLDHVNGTPGKRGESDSYHLYFERGAKSRMKPGRLVIERL